MIVKLVERKRAFGFQSQREKILSDASEEAYRVWRNQALRASIRQQSLLSKKRR